MRSCTVFKKNRVFETKEDGKSQELKTKLYFKAVFLHWGINSEDGDTYSVAIVEDKQGFVHLVEPNLIQFNTPSVPESIAFPNQPK